MAASTASHVRSISWPENVHPLTRTIQDHLFTLMSSTTTQPQPSICQKLGFLSNIYEVVNDFLHLPLTRESPTDLEQVSDGFLQVLDICSTAREVVMRTKEDIRELESAIRRRSKSGGEEALAREVDAFVSRRRAMNRTVSRFAKPTMKRTEKKRGSNSRQGLLKEVQEASFGVFLGLLMFVSQCEKQSKKRKNWNFMISKMFHNLKSSSTETGEEDGGEAEEMLGVTMAELDGLKSRNDAVCGEELKRLREVEMKVEEIETELENVYRMLVKTRVSLLNILNI